MKKMSRCTDCFIRSMTPRMAWCPVCRSGPGWRLRSPSRTGSAARVAPVHDDFAVQHDHHRLARIAGPHHQDWPAAESGRLACRVPLRRGSRGRYDGPRRTGSRCRMHGAVDPERWYMGAPVLDYPGDQGGIADWSQGHALFGPVPAGFHCLERGGLLHGMDRHAQAEFVRDPIRARRTVFGR